MPAAKPLHRKLRIGALILAVALLPRFAGAKPPLQLPGDEIQNFRVVDILRSPNPSWDWEMRLEVSYSYNAAHGKGIVGGDLLPPQPSLQSGHSYWGTEYGPEQSIVENRQSDLVRGVQRVNIAVHLNAPQAATSQLRLYLYDSGGREFVNRVFDFRRVWTRQVAQLPDLVIEGGSYEPPSPVPPGTVVRFSLKVANRGGAPVPGFIRVTGPGNVSGGIPGGLAPGAGKIVFVDYPVNSPGATYRLRFTVDPDNVIAESNKANNVSREFIVTTLK